MDLRIYLMLPIFGIMFLTFGSQLAQIASSSADKTLNYASDMENAMECAMKGISLEQCSPDLMKYEFNGKINETLNVTESFIDEYLEMLNNLSTNQTDVVIEINETQNSTIIIIQGNS